MSDAFTAKNYAITRAPKRIDLFGDKAKRVESAQHIIEFPGGAIEVSRTTDGDYWAHIIMNRGQVLDDLSLRQSAMGEIVGSRITDGSGVRDIENVETATQIAVLIRPVRSAFRPTGPTGTEP